MSNQSKSDSSQNSPLPNEEIRNFESTDNQTPLALVNDNTFESGNLNNVAQEMSHDIQDLENSLQEQVKLKRQLAVELERQQEQTRVTISQNLLEHQNELKELESSHLKKLEKRDQLLEHSKGIIQEFQKKSRQAEKNEVILANKSKELEMAINDKLAIEEKILIIEQDCSNYRNQITGLINKYNDLENEMKILSVANQENSTPHGSEQITLQNESEEKLQNIFSDFKKQKEELLNNLQKAQNELQDTQDAHKGEKADLKNVIEDLGFKLSQSSEQNIKLQQDFDDSLQTSKQQISLYENKLQDNSLNIEQLKIDYSSEISVLEGKLNDTNIDLNLKENIINELKEENIKLSQLKNEVEAKESSNKQFQIEFEQQKSKIFEEITKSSNASKVEKSQMEETHSNIISKYDIKISNLTEENEKLQLSLNNIASQSNKDILIITNKLEKANIEIINLTQQLTEFQESNTMMSNDLNLKQQQFESAIQKYTKLEQDSFKELNNLGQKIEQLNIELSKSKQDSQEKLIQVQKKFNSQKQFFDNYKTESEELKLSLSSQIQNLDATLITVSEKSEQTISELKTQLSHSSTQNNKDVEEHEIQLATLNSTISFLEQEKKRNEDDFNSLQEQSHKEIQAGKDILLQLGEEKNLIHQKFEESECDNTNLHTEIENLKLERSTINEQLSISNQNINELLQMKEYPNQLEILLKTKLTSVDLDLCSLEEKFSNLNKIKIDSNSLRNSLEKAEYEKEELIQELQQKLIEIKQLQQRQIDLKKAVSKELKLHASNQSNDSFSNSNEILNSNINNSNQEVMLLDKFNFASIQNSDRTRKLSDFEYTFENDINFLYLKNIVLKYMSSTPDEAKQLHLALFTLLKADKTEQDCVNKYWNYKESWLPSKPPPKFRSIITDDV